MPVGFGGLGWVSTWANAWDANAVTEVVISSATRCLLAATIFLSPSITERRYAHAIPSCRQGTAPGVNVADRETMTPRRRFLFDAVNFLRELAQEFYDKRAAK
jgi:hypothetical protein